MHHRWKRTKTHSQTLPLAHNSSAQPHYRHFKCVKQLLNESETQTETQSPHWVTTRTCRSRCRPLQVRRALRHNLRDIRQIRGEVFSWVDESIVFQFVLGLMKPMVTSGFLKQTAMGTAFNNTAILNDQNLISALNGRQTMRND